MKSKKLIIVGAVIVALITAIVITIVVVVNGKYFKKTDYDYVGDMSYNGVTIVGEDGLFYLCRDGKEISGGYGWIESVNEQYDDITVALKNKQDPSKLYNYYLAKKAGQAEYCLLDTDGNEYVIDGDSYVFDEVETVLPILVFKNSSSNSYAMLSLDALNSDLSNLSDNKIVMNEFDSIYIGYSPYNEDLAQYVEAFRYSNGKFIENVYNAMGKFIASGENVHILDITDVSENGKKIYATYFYDEVGKAIYSSDGTKLAQNIRDRVYRMEAETITVISEDKDGNVTGITIIGINGKKDIDMSKYDYSTAQFLVNGICLKENSSDKLAIITLEHDTATYDSVIFANGYLVAKNESAEKYAYYDDRGNFLFEHDDGNLEFNLALSGDKYYAFQPQGATAPYEIMVANSKGESAKLNVPVSSHYRLMTNHQNGDALDLPIYVKYTLKDGVETDLTVITPFETNTKSASYDNVTAYTLNGLTFVIARDEESYKYEIIELPANRVVASYEFQKEEFAMTEFEVMDEINLATDMNDADSIVPMLLIRRYFEIGLGDEIGRSHYYALYRQTTYGSATFDYATMDMYDLGSDIGKYSRSDMWYSYGTWGKLVFNGAAGGTVYAIGDDGKLKVEVELDYEVVSILPDINEPSKLYIVVYNNGLYGLYTSEGTEVLAPYYDSIEFVDGEYIGVSRSGAVGVLRYRKGKVKTVVDFEYSRITCLGDGAFVLTDPEEHRYIFEGNDMIFDKPIQKISYVTDISETEEGYKSSHSVILVCEGKLYMHKGEVKADIMYYDENDYNRPSSPNYYFSTLTLNDGANIVFYYKNDEYVGCDFIFLDVNPTVDPDKLTVFDSLDNGGWTEMEDSGYLVTKQDVCNDLENNDDDITLYYVAP